MAANTIPKRYTKQHEKPAGAGDGRPTTTQILQDNGVIGRLSDKTFLVTGGTDGLGLESVRSLAKTGAHVFFTARNEEKALKVLQELKDEGKTDKDLEGAKIDWVKIDNASLESVKAGAEDFLNKSKQLNVLICNAGVANVPYARTKEGHEIQFGVNHLAHFYLFQLLKPLLLSSSTPSFNSRVVTVSSTAHGFSTVQIGNYHQEQRWTSGIDPLAQVDSDYNTMAAYGQSKTANIWMTNEIDRRYGAKGLHGLAIHPGNILTAGWGSVDPIFAERVGPLMELDAIKNGFKNVQQGAATQVLAAIGKDYEGKGGLYLDDCDVSSPLADDEMVGVKGYRPWAFDPEGEKKLWADSLEIVGLKDDQ